MIDTSQLSNSNKWMNYREAYLAVPLLVTVGCTTSSTGVAFGTSGTSIDFGVSLKNWYGSIIHSVSLDINGSTVIQQTPFQSLWNTFKLMTTLSFQDVLTFGPTIGFYPDNSSSVKYQGAASTGGLGTCNNQNLQSFPSIVNYNAQEPFNRGFYERQRKWNYNASGVSGSGTYVDLLTTDSLKLQYKSYIINTKTGLGTGTANGIWQVFIMSTIFLKHLHSFFDKLLY